MSLPVGGKADKIGNKYEICCVILELLKLVDKKNGVEYVTYEPFGDEESGTDFIVGNNNGSTVYVQCKASYRNNIRWTYAPLELAISKWKNIMNEKTNSFRIVSPLEEPKFQGVKLKAGEINCVKNEFTQNESKFLKNLCKSMNLDYERDSEFKKVLSFWDDWNIRLNH